MQLVLADVAEDVRDDRAQEEQGDDHDDRDEGEKQTVLNEGLAFLVVALETSQKSADEVLIIVLGTSFPEDLLPERKARIRQRNGRMVLPAPSSGPYLAPERRSCQYLPVTVRRTREPPLARAAPWHRRRRPGGPVLSRRSLG